LLAVRAPSSSHDDRATNAKEGYLNGSYGTIPKISARRTALRPRTQMIKYSIAAVAAASALLTAAARQAAAQGLR
jgi:hypothetical protein